MEAERAIDLADVRRPVHQVAVVIVRRERLGVHRWDVGRATNALIEEEVGTSAPRIGSELRHELLTQVPKRLPDDESVVMNLAREIVRPLVLVVGWVEIAERLVVEM